MSLVSDVALLVLDAFNRRRNSAHILRLGEIYDITSLQDFFIMIYSLNRGFPVSNHFTFEMCHDQINPSQ